MENENSEYISFELMSKMCCRTMDESKIKLKKSVGKIIIS